MRHKPILFFACVFCLSVSLAVSQAFAAEEAEKTVTQGSYAVALAQNLGLDESPTVSEAVSKLKEMGIEPDDGWQPDEEMTSDIVLQIYHHMLEAAESGKLDLTSEQMQKMLRDLGVNFNLPLPSELSRPAAHQTAPAPSTLGGAGGGGGASVSE
ncbi:MAG: hypothetical protein HY801_13770 [Candidatus Lindowbacteria bacterium]|nr:hypothetical protein [Candidatus Lindowbacteria bacterium]